MATTARRQLRALPMKARTTSSQQGHRGAAAGAAVLRLDGLTQPQARPLPRRETQPGVPRWGNRGAWMARQANGTVVRHACPERLPPPAHLAWLDQRGDGRGRFAEYDSDVLRPEHAGGAGRRRQRGRGDARAWSNLARVGLRRAWRAACASDQAFMGPPGEGWTEAVVHGFTAAEAGPVGLSPRAWPLTLLRRAKTPARDGLHSRRARQIRANQLAARSGRGYDDPKVARRGVVLTAGSGRSLEDRPPAWLGRSRRTDCLRPARDGTMLGGG